MAELKEVGSTSTFVPLIRWAPRTTLYCFIFNAFSDYKAMVESETFKWLILASTIPTTAQGKATYLMQKLCFSLFCESSNAYKSPLKS